MTPRLVIPSWANAAPSRSVPPALTILPLAAAEVKHAIQNENEVIGQNLSQWLVHALERQLRWPRWTCVPIACTPMQVRFYAGELQAEYLCCMKLVEAHNLCHRMGLRRDGVGPV